MHKVDILLTNIFVVSIIINNISIFIPSMYLNFIKNIYYKFISREKI